MGNQAVLRLLRAKPDDLEVRSNINDVTRFAHDFSQIPIHPKSLASIQAELPISSAGDVYEEEADRVSEQVMHMPEPQLQRACACGGGCPRRLNEQAGHKHLQTEHVRADNTREMVVPSIVHEVLRSPGRPLDSGTRADMELRFGHDLSRVRVHTDEDAARSANAVNALAYTVGQDVVFSAGQYAPETSAGQRLLAHELTHTIQQRNAVCPEVKPLRLSNAETALENEAETVTDAVVRQESFAPPHNASVTLARQRPPATAPPARGGARRPAHGRFYDERCPLLPDGIPRRDGSGLPEQINPCTRGHNFEGRPWVVYENELRVDGDQAWLYQNPGAVHSYTGTRARRESGALGIGTNRVMIFPNSEAGARYIATVLRGYVRRRLTVRQAMERYTQGDPRGNYTQMVQEAFGLNPNARLREADVERIARLIAGNEGPGHGEIFYRDDPNNPVWVQEIFRRTAPAQGTAAPSTRSD